MSQLSKHEQESKQASESNKTAKQDMKQFSFGARRTSTISDKKALEMFQNIPKQVDEDIRYANERGATISGKKQKEAKKPAIGSMEDDFDQFGQEQAIEQSPSGTSKGGEQIARKLQSVQGYIQQNSDDHANQIGMEYQRIISTDDPSTQGANKDAQAYAKLQNSASSLTSILNKNVVGGQILNNSLKQQQLQQAGIRSKNPQNVPSEPNSHQQRLRNQMQHPTTLLTHQLESLVQQNQSAQHQQQIDAAAGGVPESRRSQSLAQQVFNNAASLNKMASSLNPVTSSQIINGQNMNSQLQQATKSMSQATAQCAAPTQSVSNDSPRAKLSSMLNSDQVMTNVAAFAASRTASAQQVDQNIQNQQSQQTVNQQETTTAGFAGAPASTSRNQQSVQQAHLFATNVGVNPGSHLMQQKQQQHTQNTNSGMIMPFDHQCNAGGNIASAAGGASNINNPSASIISMNPKLSQDLIELRHNQSLYQPNSAAAAAAISEHHYNHTANNPSSVNNKSNEPTGAALQHPPPSLVSQQYMQVQDFLNQQQSNNQQNSPSLGSMLIDQAMGTKGSLDLQQQAQRLKPTTLQQQVLNASAAPGNVAARLSSSNMLACTASPSRAKQRRASFSGAVQQVESNNNQNELRRISMGAGNYVTGPGQQPRRSSIGCGSLGLPPYLVQQQQSPIDQNQQPWLIPGQHRISEIFNRTPEAINQLNSSYISATAAQNTSAAGRNQNSSIVHGQQQLNQAFNQQQASMARQDSGGNLSNLIGMNLAYMPSESIQNSNIDAIRPPEQRLSMLQNNLNFVYDNGQEQQKQPVQRNSSAKQTLTGLVSFIDSNKQMQKMSSSIPSFKNEYQPKQEMNSAEKLSPEPPGINVKELSDHDQKSEDQNQKIDHQDSQLEARQKKQEFTVDEKKKSSENQLIVHPEPGNHSGDVAYKNTPRLPYMGLQQLTAQKTQLSHRHVQDGHAPSSAQGNLDKITSVEVDANKKDKQENLDAQSDLQKPSEKEIHVPYNIPLINSCQQRIQSEDLSKIQHMKENQRQNPQIFTQVNLTEAAQQSQSKLYPESDQIINGVQENLQTEKNQVNQQINQNSDQAQRHETDDAHMQYAVASQHFQSVNQGQQQHMLEVNNANATFNAHNGMSEHFAFNAPNQPVPGQNFTSQRVPISQQNNNATQNAKRDTHTSFEQPNFGLNQHGPAESQQYRHGQITQSAGSREVQPATTRNQFDPLLDQDEAYKTLCQKTAQSQDQGRNNNDNLVLEVDMDEKASDQDSSDSSYSAASDDHQLTKNAVQQITMAPQISIEQKQDQQPQNSPLEAQDKVQMIDGGMASFNRQKLQQEQSHQQQSISEANKLLEVKDDNNNQKRNLLQQSSLMDDLGHTAQSALATRQQQTSQPANAVLSPKIHSMQPQTSNQMQLSMSHQQHAQPQPQQYLSTFQQPPNAPLPQVTQQSSSEVTRYLLNQLEQVHIKLKALGYCKSDIRTSTPSSNQNGLNMQQQAFTTIDNFSTEVLSLHSHLSAAALQTAGQGGYQLPEQLVDINFRVLHSLTSVVQIMWQQLESVNSNGERILQKQSQHHHHPLLQPQLSSSTLAQQQLLPAQGHQLPSVTAKMSGAMLASIPFLANRISGNLLAVQQQQQIMPPQVANPAIQQPLSRLSHTSLNSAAVMKANMEMHQVFHNKPQQFGAPVVNVSNPVQNITMQQHPSGPQAFVPAIAQPAQQKQQSLASSMAPPPSIQTSLFNQPNNTNQQQAVATMQQHGEQKQNASSMSSYPQSLYHPNSQKSYNQHLHQQFVNPQMLPPIQQHQLQSSQQQPQQNSLPTAAQQFVGMAQSQGSLMCAGAGSLGQLSSKAPQHIASNTSQNNINLSSCGGNTSVVQQLTMEQQASIQSQQNEQ